MPKNEIVVSVTLHHSEVEGGSREMFRVGLPWAIIEAGEHLENENIDFSMDVGRLEFINGVLDGAKLIAETYDRHDRLIHPENSEINKSND